MSKMHEVDPNVFIDVHSDLPANGRGAWTRTGIGFDYRYAIAPDGVARIGSNAEVSLDHWAVAAGCWAIQRRLEVLGHMEKVTLNSRGIFGKRTRTAVIKFQRVNRDPDGNAQLDDDGTVGRSDARALFTPVVRDAEERYEIPDSLLLGETNHESAMDPGAVGYYVYYPDFRGVDRGMSQINSLYNPQVTWVQAYFPYFSLDWSANRLRTFYTDYNRKYPAQLDTVLWDAAVCAHNNPSAAGKWASSGVAPTEQAAAYVNAVKAARY